MGFFYNLNVTSITIGDNVQFKNNSMYNAFASCVRLNSPVTIPNSVTNISNAFAGCSAFNQPVTIPDGCEDMSNAFRNCRNFNQPVTIPSGITNSFAMFNGCNNFNQPVMIPDGVTTIAYLFWGATKFNHPVTIPNSVTDTRGIFLGCANFNQPVEIPVGATDMIETFGGCTNMSGNVIIRSKNIAHDVWGGKFGLQYTFMGKSNAKRVNIFTYGNSTTNKSLYASNDVHGLAGPNSFTWSKATNCYYNSAYNIYVYYNLT